MPDPGMMSETLEEGVRLNKFLAQCGLGSRRSCENLIRQGFVEINGQVVTDLAVRILPSDHVRCEGKLLHQQKTFTLLLNKPAGCLCTRKDPRGRPTIYDVVPAKFHKLNYIGRLDFNTTGLILLTNSGELNEQLTHPRYHVEKEYHVMLDRQFTPDFVPQLLEGFRLEEGLARAEAVEIVGQRRVNVVLTQGFNRQIRRMFNKIGYKVRYLERFRIGSLVDYDLQPGCYRVADGRMLRAAVTNPR